MSYPYGAAVVPPVLPDLPFTTLQRRQGDVRATLITLSLNGQPINIAGWTFTFSVTFPTGIQTVIWTVQSPSSGAAITTIAGSGFAIPAFNSTVSPVFTSTTQFAVGNQIFITGAGVYTVMSIASATQATILNSGLAGNLSNGNVAATAPVYQLGQTGMTVLVIPASITSNPVGSYPMYAQYTTINPSPGPYVQTFMQGNLQLILP